MPTTDGTPTEPLPLHIALIGREAEARAVTLNPGDALSRPAWETLRALKVERESFVLFDTVRERRLDPDWVGDQAGLSPGALILIGDAKDFPDPLVDYRVLLKTIQTSKVWPIAEQTGHDLLALRMALAITQLEHASLAREAGVAADDAVVLWDWKPLKERQREEYAILLHLAKSSTVVSEGVLKKLAELRVALGFSNAEHMKFALLVGLDTALASRLLEGTAPIPKTHLEYVAALVSAKGASFSTETLSRLRDVVVKNGIKLDVHRKLAAQAGITPDLADACFEDQDAVPVGRRFYTRELLAAVAHPQLTPDDLTRIKELRERYTIKRPEHMRHCREWGIAEHAAAALWELRPPSKGLSLKSFLKFCGLALAVLLISPPGQSVVKMAITGVGDLFRAPSGYDAEGFDPKGFDRQGYDKRGFDKEGFDRSGYDRQGYNRQGFNRAGLDRAGFDKNGLDKDGRDKEGFDTRGYNRQGFDRKGIDKDGFDQNSLDAKGFDRNGFDVRGFNKDGFDRHGRDRDGFDKAGYDGRGYDRKGFDKTGHDKDGFDRTGYDADGYDRKGFDHTGYNKDGFDENGFDRKGYDKEGYDRGGCNRRGFNRGGEPCVAATPGTSPTGTGSRAPSAAPATVYDADGYDSSGYDRSGFNRSNRDRRGYDRQGFDADGYNRDSFDRGGLNRQGVDKSGFSRDGYNPKGYDRQGYNRAGFTHEGRGRDGSDLLPGPLATLQSESAGWSLGVGQPPARRIYRVGDTVPPLGVKLERVGGNMVMFRHNGWVYDRKLMK